MCFNKRPITFGGSPEDLVWLYAATQKRKQFLVAEPPCEVVCMKNGAIKDVYANQKITHAYTKNSVVKYYFVNVKMPCQTTWGTAQQYEYKDFESGKIVSIGANGVVAFHICDSKKFIEKVLGSRDRYTSTELRNEMLAKIMDVFGDFLLAVIEENHLGYAQLDGLLKEIGGRMLPKLNESVAKYGIHIEEFIIKQLVKPGVLKEKVNERAEKTEEFDDAKVDKDRKLSLLKQEEEIELQKLKMDENRAEHTSKVAKIGAQTDADIEKLKYDAKGMSYRELREMDQADARVAAEGEAKIREATKMPEVTIVRKENVSGKCPHCGGDVTAEQIFCPTCKRKL